MAAHQSGFEGTYFNTSFFHRMTEQESTYFAVVGCMDGKSNGPATEFGRTLTGRVHADVIARAGLVKTVYETGKLDNGVVDQLKISFGHHGAKTAIVHSHDPKCAGFVADRAAHEEATSQTASKIEEQFREMGVRAYPVLVDTHTGRINRLARRVPVVTPQS